VKRDAEDESFWIFLVFSCVFHGSWFRAGECSFKIAYTTTVEPFARALADWLKIGALWRGADETASHCRTTRRLTVSFFVSLAFSSYYPGLYESLHVSQARSMPLARSRFS